MTPVSGNPLRSYRPGTWFGLVGERALVALPPSEKARVTALWELVDEGAGFDVTLDALISAGLRDLPGFVLVSTDEGQTDVVIRGAAVATFTVGGEEVVVEGSSATTWVERSLHVGRADADRARGGRRRRRVRAVVRRGRRALPGLADRGDPAGRRPRAGRCARCTSSSPRRPAASSRSPRWPRSPRSRPTSRTLEEPSAEPTVEPTTRRRAGEDEAPIWEPARSRRCRSAPRSRRPGRPRRPTTTTGSP